MKRILFICILVNLIYLAEAKKGKEPSEIEGKDKTATILVLGLDKGDIQSNYYMTEDIARGIKTSLDSLEIAYNEALINKLNSSSKSNFNYVTINDINVDKKNLNHLFTRSGADYILSFEKLEVNWKGEPYDILFNIIDFSLYDRDADSLVDGQSYYDVSELTPFSQIEKKLQRMADKIALQASKAIE
ncbi:MAG: hypothetical protein PVF73_01125 [Bacteroidales bacterium]|jgi:hypothetical protein